MYLIVKGLRLPKKAEFWEHFATEEEGDLFFAKHGESSPTKPKWAVTLRDTLWPDDVKAKIAEQLALAGFERPLDQKLVEPYCLAFGGRDDDGAFEGSGVDWEFVTDYFEWETANVFDVEHSFELQEKSLKKRGFMFSHKCAYAEP